MVSPIESGYSANAACVGSGTRVYGAQAWRFLPDDFRMASKYGVPSGSSLADWPITYEELAPDYERAEWELGVSGDEETAGRHRPRHRTYPMPPLPMNAQGRTLQTGADALGWDTQRVPLLINSVPYNGREACVHCQQCVGFACPTDAKNGTQNTLIPRALATGLCTLETEAMAECIDTDTSGSVVGVTYWTKDGRSISVKSAVVIVSGGAIETARLLLNSKSSAHPHGLGNAHDQVGRSLQGHYYAGAVGWMPESIWDGIGPGATTATIKFSHNNSDRQGRAVVGGGMLADDFIVQPINFQKGRVPADVPRWGLAHKQWMRHHYTRMLIITGPVQEIPSPDARVSVDPGVTDKYGLPVARLSGTTHPETLRTYNYLNTRAAEWTTACGAENVVANTAGLFLSGGQHQAGTCRMGDDPQTSVTDRWGRVHGHDNLYIADGSLHVTNGGFNPVLTILALSYRVAAHLVRSW
jgi:choline dehydrogenase-like flavoprotein